MVLKEDYTELLRKDISTISNLKDWGYISSVEDFQNIYENGLEDCIKITDFSKFGLLSELGKKDKETKLIKLIDDDVIRQVLNGRVLESAKFDYKKLDDEQRKMYLNVLSQELNPNTSGITTIFEMKELCDIVLEHDSNNEQPKNETEKAVFVQKMREFTRQRPDPINDLIELYKCKIPREFQFIYEEVMNNFERNISENKLGDVSEDLIRKMVQIAPNNSRIQGDLANVLSKQYSKKGLTTNLFLEEIVIPSIRDIRADDISEEAYWKTRTQAYMASIGKENDAIQEILLMQLQKGKINHYLNIKTPQYIPYKNLKQDEEVVVIGTFNGAFTARTSDMSGLELNENVVVQQNKGKKGIRGLFKKKKEKEIITETIVVDKKENIIQAINRYETGRFEIVELAQKKSKVRVVNREDVLAQDIGNNGAMILKKPIVEKVDVQYGKDFQQEKQSTKSQSTER